MYFTSKTTCFQNHIHREAISYTNQKPIIPMKSVSMMNIINLQYPEFICIQIVLTINFYGTQTSKRFKSLVQLIFIYLRISLMCQAILKTNVSG